MNKISLIGLGKLGLPLATCFACDKEYGSQILGIDIDQKKIEILSKNC